MKRARWLVYWTPLTWVAFDRDCPTNKLSAAAPCTCGYFPTWQKALAYVNRVERARAVEAIQDGAQ